VRLLLKLLTILKTTQTTASPPAHGAEIDATVSGRAAGYRCNESTELGSKSVQADIGSSCRRSFDSWATRVAEQYLSPGKMTIVVVGEKAKIGEQIKMVDK
jgi:hypothetical protein